MFLCNKTDTTEEAEHYDSDATSQALSKQETVFAELKKLNLLPEEDDIGSCQVYHGVSAKNIRSARINKMENDFTENFARFQRCFQMVLANSIKRQIKLAIEGMLSVQEQFILAIGDLSASSQNLSKFLSVASETEKEVMRVLLEKVSGNLVSKETINELLHRIKEETVEEAKCYRKSEGGTDPGVQAALSQFKGKSRAEVEGALRFISDMTCTISHKVATTILRTFGRSLEATISASSEDLQRAIEQITLPSLRRALARLWNRLEQIQRKGERCSGDKPEVFIHSNRDASGNSISCSHLFGRGSRPRVCARIWNRTVLVFFVNHPKAVV